jgi:hypothetical protein
LQPQHLFLCQEFFREAIYDVGSFEKLCRT